MPTKSWVGKLNKYANLGVLMGRGHIGDKLGTSRRQVGDSPDVFKTYLSQSLHIVNKS